MAAWLSSTGISHQDLLPQIPSIRLSTVNSGPRPGIAPQSLNSTPRHWAFQGTRIPACVCGRSKVCLLLIPFGLPQTSRFTLSLKCLSSDADNCLDVRTGPLLQFSDPLRAGPVLLTLLFLPLVPSSYRVLGGSRYSLPLGRSSCPHSAGVLHAFPCLKACS